MTSARKIVSVVLVALLGATIYGLFRTGASTNGIAVTATAQQGAQVDEGPLLTALRLAQMPTSAAELPFAKDALRFADKEMDLAFAAAVLEATAHPPVLNREANAIQARLQKAEDALAAEQAHLAQLNVAESKAFGSKKDALDDQLDLAKAQVELDQDEVDDAKEDLIRTGGDPQGHIQSLIQEHEAASQASDTNKINVGELATSRGLINRFQQWLAIEDKLSQLRRAQRDANAAAVAFSAKHDSLERQIEARASFQLTDSGSLTSDSPTPADSISRAQSAAKVKITKRRAVDEKMLATFDKRVGNEKELADIYAKWIDVGLAQERKVLNFALRGTFIILMIAAINLFSVGRVEHLLGKMSMDRRQVGTLRIVTRVVLQIVAVLLILLVIFGPPSQLGTFLGLAGAGLTVALKDFVIGFFGWFVLMGKNGIRLGDWVEINGVTGEVVQLGMFHTVLLETGNWTDSGHPTGRRVTFTNSFAIEGHYFNFSTSGQWLWDELQIVLSAGKNPYPVIDAIQKKVAEATLEGGRQAEQEWRNAENSREMTAVSAAPAITVKPVIGGTQITVRYITRAHERSQLRAKLNSAAVDLLGELSGLPASTPQAASAARSSS